MSPKVEQRNATQDDSSVCEVILTNPCASTPRRLPALLLFLNKGPLDARHLAFLLCLARTVPAHACAPRVVDFQAAGYVYPAACRSEGG